MQTPLMTRRRVTAGLVSATLLLTACGSTDGGSDAGAGEALPQLDDESGSDGDAATGDGEATSAPEGSVPAGSVPAGSVPAGSMPAGSMPAGSMPAGSMPAGSVMVDLVGEDVLAESEFDANLLPSVVVDDLNTGRKVNFRNLVPQDKPILLWMWAPH